MKTTSVCIALLAGALALAGAGRVEAQSFPLLAVGTLDQTRAGAWADLSGLTYPLENGAKANLLGGMGSAITHVSGNTFLALPDRGPNAVEFDDAIDNTASYINRFHTIQMELKPNKSGSGTPFTLTPTLTATTLLWSATPLVYGTGAGLGVGSGVPPINNFFVHFFTGRSDDFDPKHNSGDPNDARFDTEGLRVSNDGRHVYISDEYGPYVYEFDRYTGMRTRSFTLPPAFYVTNLSAVGQTEIEGNTSGRVANKGMEGLAITPDGRTLVGIMQNALIQDATAEPNLLRLVTIDIASGRVTHQYGYLLTTGSGVSEILALNSHEFIVDERDGHGRADASNAKVKQLFKIDLAGATDISRLDATDAAAAAVPKTLFVDLVASLKAAGWDPAQIPAKIEGISFGQDVLTANGKVHTLWVANDNDFLNEVALKDGSLTPNDNQFFVFSFTDDDLGGSKYDPQKVEEFPGFPPFGFGPGPFFW